MIDGLFKAKQDKLWDMVGRLVAKTSITPNQITVLCVVLTLGCSGAYVVHKSTLVFGITLALAELLDNVDGAVARVTKSATKFGAYLDAATDRYKESIILAAVAHVTGWWDVAFVALSGSLITSYNKARAGMEIPVSNEKWPDMFERFERFIVLIAGLALAPFFSPTLLWGKSLLWGALLVIAVMSTLSSIQRLFRARQLFLAHEARTAPPSAHTSTK